MRLLAAATAVLLLFASPALAAPVSTPQIEAKRAEAAKAQTTLEDMRTDLEVQVEEYNKIDEALNETRGRIVETQARLDAADASLQRAQALLQDRAEGMYRGGNVGMLDVLVGTTSFEDFLTRVDIMMRIGASDAALVSDVKTLKAQVSEAKQSLEQRAAEQVSLRSRAEAKAEEIKASIARQKSFVDSLNVEVARLIQEEQARREAEARERARRLAAAQAAAAAAARASRGSSTAERAGTNPSGGGHPEAVGIAMKYLGVPYLWGGTTPLGFDCSGLVQYVYRQIGIDIPRTSQEQYYAGTHISSNVDPHTLKPGDLLFFGRNADPGRVHHVVMYAGGDDIIEAPYSGASVTVSSLQARLARGEYVGASRF